MGRKSEETDGDDRQTNENEVSSSFSSPLDDATAAASLSSPQSSSRVSVRDASSNVLVAVRVRPLLACEAYTDDCTEVLAGSMIRIGGTQGVRFTFDQVFDTSTGQEALYNDQIEPLVHSCLEGYNATILAYGQTGSGKTYTIMGPSISAVQDDDATAGVIPRAVRKLFSLLEEQRQKQLQSTEASNKDEPVYQVRIQFLELYGEEIRDLLATNTSTAAADKLTIRDLGTDEPEVVGATQQPVSSADEALLCLTHGMLRRVTASTAMNESSSRSHAILSVLVEQTVILDRSAEGEEHVQVKRSKFSFVDLAGSERQKRTQAEGKRLREGIDINKGLLVLGNVVSALGDPKKIGKTFVPYRDSKLTRLLKGSLGGNHRTLMIACVSPSSSNMDESLNCLRYANRAKNIQCNAIVNVDAGSRLVAELKVQVQALATDLLRSIDHGDTSVPRFSREVLENLAEGGTSNVPISSRTQSRDVGITGATSRASQVEQRLKETEIELSRTRDLLRESQRNHDAAEEQLYVAKGEKELYELQLSVLSKDGNVKSVDAPQKAFLQKATEYEKTIGKLRAALRSAEAKANRMSHAKNSILEDEKSFVAIDQAKKALDEDRERLNRIKSAVDWNDSGSPGVPNIDSRSTQKSLLHLEADEKAEQEELNVLTRKYLEQAGHVDEDDELSNAAEEDTATAATPVPVQPQRNLQADLVELSRSIAAKEDLIDQLKISQEKYASMREFYEEKLKQMKDTLDEREIEREQLVMELERAKETDACSKDLEQKLREKDKHIANLRKKRGELIDLTAVSSRNHSEITRLQTDVKDMKRKKVDLQKQLSTERKSHACEVKKLQKTALQKERELNKWKKVSSQREIQAQRASQVAKARLEELGHLRTKYKDAEKRVRMLSVKRGVMAKAGLDPVIVGRRNPKKERGVGDSNQRNRSAFPSPKIDADSMRDYYDQKVAEVVRKEALVDKLAQEWEEHFQLTTKKQEIEEAGAEGSGDSLQSLSIQIRFKEDQIRRLAQRLTKQQLTPGKDDSSAIDDDAFLHDADFAKLCAGSSPEKTRSVVVRVLFGMVVRERRRIAALARTASSLDERVQAAEKSAEASELALRSYMEEQRHELAALTQNQQEHILSLMDMVKEGSEHSFSRNSKVAVPAEEAFSPKLLVLANEQIAVLERRLAELQTDSSAIDSYRGKIEDLSASLTSKSQECDELEDNVSELRSALRQIREAASLLHSDDLPEEYAQACSKIESTVKEALHPSQTPSAKPRRKSPRGRVGRSYDKSGRPFLSPRLKKHIELMHTSDSAEDLDDAPEWASDIMADLAMIAEGKVPPSLEGSPALLAGESQLERGSVFDRLTDPESFTGTQKMVQLRKKGRNEGQVSVPASPHGKEDRRAMSRSIANRLDKIVIPDGGQQDGPGSEVTPRGPHGDEETPINENRLVLGSDQKGYKSVFERLVSPSHYTGTQKEKFQTSRVKRERAAEDVADRLLDDLLESDNERLEEPRTTEKGTESRSMYTEQDVFERLQRTTTQSYAVKHNAAMFPDMSPNDERSREAPLSTPRFAAQISAAESESVKRFSPTFEPHSEYTRQDVFERLQNTTTEAYAKKTNKLRHDERD